MMKTNNISKKAVKKGVFFWREAMSPYFCAGEMAERSNAAVLKTVEVKASGGSNPSLSAESKFVPRQRAFLCVTACKIYFAKPCSAKKLVSVANGQILVQSPPSKGSAKLIPLSPPIKVNVQP